LAVATQVKVQVEKKTCDFALTRQGFGGTYTRCISEKNCFYQKGASCSREDVMPLKHAENEDKSPQNGIGYTVAVVLSMEIAKKSTAPLSEGISDKTGNGGC